MLCTTLVQSSISTGLRGYIAEWDTWVPIEHADKKAKPMPIENRKQPLCFEIICKVTGPVKKCLGYRVFALQSSKTENIAGGRLFRRQK